MRPLIADRMSRIRVSQIREMFALTQGKSDVISLGIGEPAPFPPQHVIDATKKALDEGRTKYSPTEGIFPLRRAISKKYDTEYGLEYSPQDQVVVTCGGVEAIVAALLACVNPGEEVLVPSPGFIGHWESVKLADGIPVPVPSSQENSFCPSPDTINELVTEKTKAIIINSPNNPTGATLNRDILKPIVEIAIENDLMIISDEVYEKFVYDDFEHTCIASLDAQDRTIVINAFSKTFCMPGFRVGYAVGPKDLMQAFNKVHMFVTTCSSTIAQFGALAALKGSQDYVKNMVNEFDQNRHLIVRELNRIGFSCNLPKGAFYCFPKIQRPEFSSSENFSKFLIQKAKVVTVPGSAFGPHGEGFIRISYPVPADTIQRAIERIEKALS